MGRIAVWLHSNLQRHHKFWMSSHPKKGFVKNSFVCLRATTEKEKERENERNNVSIYVVVISIGCREIQSCMPSYCAKGKCSKYWVCAHAKKNPCKSICLALHLQENCLATAEIRNSSQLNAIISFHFLKPTKRIHTFLMIAQQQRQSCATFSLPPHSHLFMLYLAKWQEKNDLIFKHCLGIAYFWILYWDASESKMSHCLWRKTDGE